jgi:hypothetical protein
MLPQLSARLACVRLFSLSRDDKLLAGDRKSAEDSSLASSDCSNESRKKRGQLAGIYSAAFVGFHPLDSTNIGFRSFRYCQHPCCETLSPIERGEEESLTYINLQRLLSEPLLCTPNIFHSISLYRCHNTQSPILHRFISVSRTLTNSAEL